MHKPYKKQTSIIITQTELIWDILNDIQRNKYFVAKERLLNTFEESESKRIQRLVTACELGGLKPSHLYKKLKLWRRKTFPRNVPVALKNILLDSYENMDELAMGVRVMRKKICAVSAKERNVYSLSYKTK